MSTYKHRKITVHEIVSQKDSDIFELEKIKERVEKICVEQDVPRVFWQCFRDEINDIIDKIDYDSKL